MDLTRRSVLGHGATLAMLSSPLGAALASTGAGFVLAKEGQAPAIWVDPQDHAGVARAAGDLAADVGRVTGTPGEVVRAATTDRPLVLVGSIGRSHLLDALIASGRLDVSDIQGKWESYIVETVKHPLPGVAEALVIVGSDKRGAIYGVYDVSRTIGVSPWYWWADVPVEPRSRIDVRRGRYVQGPPAVKYRGVFLNDEQPCLGRWTTEKFGGMNAAFYTKLFELLLRLRANYLWPAMWANAFGEDDPRNPELANEYGIVMGTSHHEPMARAHEEWTRHRADYGNGEWNYVTNREGVQRFFREGISKNRNNEILVTVGMRGDGDVAMTSTGSLQSDIHLLETIISDQRNILQEELRRPPANVPQLWALFTEVLKYYEAGLKLPNDVTLLFTDDNIGNLRRLPTAAERERAGGSGIYYHMDMNGGPFSYKWINSNPLPKIWEQMNLAHEYGANQIWIANVGDFKPLEVPIDFWLAFAWDPKAIAKDDVANWTREWAARAFGSEFSAEAGALIAEYAKINGWCKPELVAPNTYSLVYYREAERLLERWHQLGARAEDLNQRIPAEARAAFYQLVLHPVRACSNLAELQIAAGRNKLYSQQGRASTNLQAERVKALFRRDQEITRYYNKELADGKWDHLMDQDHIGYFDWFSPPQDIMPAVTELLLEQTGSYGVAVDGATYGWPGYYLPPELPTFDSVSRQRSYFEIFSRGGLPFEAQVEASDAWIEISRPDLLADSASDRRYWVTIDWARAPQGRSAGHIKVSGSQAPVTISIHAINATDEQKREARGCFGGLCGPVSFSAAKPSRSIDIGEVGWRTLPDYGRESAAMTIFPVDAASFPKPIDAPRLEYDVFLAEAGTYYVDIVTNPTLNVNPANRLGLAVAIDDQVPQVYEVFVPDRRESEDFEGKAFRHNARINARILPFRVDVGLPGRHVLKIMMVDPTVVLQKIILHKDVLPDTFFGPPETSINV